MRRLLTWLSGAVGGIAAYRWLARRRHAPLGPPVAPPPAPPPAPEAPVEADRRAAELRAKLEESRSLLDERDEFEAGETTVDSAEAAPTTPEERRRRVHEEGRSAVEEMRRSSEP